MKSIFFLLVFLISTPSFGQELVLTGTPSKTIEIDQFGERRVFDDPSEVDLRIVKDGENLYWASRGNVQLAVTSAGIYITYIAIDGSGYTDLTSKTIYDR